MNRPPTDRRPAEPVPPDGLLDELVLQAVQAATELTVAGPGTADPTATGPGTAELTVAGPGPVAVRRIAARLAANAMAAVDPVLPGFCREPAPDGACTLLPGLGTTHSAAAAAALNAAAITVSQCDEGLREARGHPGLHAFAAGLAAAEAEDLTLAGFLHALAVGWEVGARLGLLLGPPRPGVHPHGGWGTAAAAAAAGVAVGLDTAGIADAVNVALTVGLAGPDASTRGGHNSHYLLPALGTANGLTTAYLVRDGLCPPAPALAHFSRLAHQAGPTAAAVHAALAPAPVLLDAYFKPAGFCAHTLTSWTAAGELATEISAAEVAEVEVVTYAGAAWLDERRPANRLARQFSIPWAVACGLTGPDALRSISGSFDDPFTGLAQLAKRVTVRHDPALDSGYPAGRPATVQVRTGTGRRYTASATFHPGDREKPMSPTELDAVDAGLLAAANAPPAATELLRHLAQAPGTVPVRHLTTPLSDRQPATFPPPARKEPHVDQT